MKQFPFRGVAEIDIGYARALCMRITYVGELGYELYIPVEQSQYVYDLITSHEDKFQLKHAGLRALGSLRMEKAYRDYGHDIDNTDTILECGLGFTCDFGKPEGFIGMEQVLSQKKKAKEDGGHRKRMAQVLLQDPDPLMHHGEVLWRNGKRVSEIRSASYGHTLGAAVGLTMLENDDPINKKWIQEGTWSVEIAGDMFPCTVSLAPLYDPKNERIKCDF
uniref:Glycine cleavage T-protein C-terminal barrel domain-containing protein n=1 Tax=Trieres chinensis TaxID=1514140 RepID=A0A7S1ZLG9_TRICV